MSKELLTLKNKHSVSGRDAIFIKLNFNEVVDIDRKDKILVTLLNRTEYRNERFTYQDIDVRNNEYIYAERDAFINSLKEKRQSCIILLQQSNIPLAMLFDQVRTSQMTKDLWARLMNLQYSGSNISEHTLKTFYNNKVPFERYRDYIIKLAKNIDKIIKYVDHTYQPPNSPELSPSGRAPIPKPPSIPKPMGIIHNPLTGKYIKEDGKTAALLRARGII